MKTAAVITVGTRLESLALSRSLHTCAVTAGTLMSGRKSAPCSTLTTCTPSLRYSRGGCLVSWSRCG